MARGDECKTASKANYACKNLDVCGPEKKPITAPKKEEKPKPNYGSYGAIYKDKKHFADMHFC